MGKGLAMATAYPIVYFILFFWLSIKANQRDGLPGALGVVIAWFIFNFFILGV